MVKANAASDTHELDLSDLVNGIYILKITDDKGALIKTEKIILSK
jgi:hypothetical protein